MLTINVDNLKNNINELKKLIDKYEDNAMRIAKEMQDAELYWHDDNSEDFFKNITKQKVELRDFLSSLTKASTSYEEIVKRINKIKNNIKTIFFDDTKKSTINEAYTKSIDALNSIKSRLNNLSTWFCTSYERSIIKNEATNLGNTITSLEAAKNNLDALFSKFTELENSIIIIMSKIQIESISTIDYSNYL